MVEEEEPAWGPLGSGVDGPADAAADATVGALAQRREVKRLDLPAAVRARPRQGPRWWAWKARRTAPMADHHSEADPRTALHTSMAHMTRSR